MTPESALAIWIGANAGGCVVSVLIRGRRALYWEAFVVRGIASGVAVVIAWYLSGR